MATHVIHVEVVGRDGAKLQKFYEQAFGWGLETNNPDGYGMYREQNGLTAGFGKAQDGGAGHVTFYVHADDPEATLRRVEKLGGKIVMPLTKVAPETTIALFADPEGHIVGLM
jgi:predicted enzyme related to lactoylglutathione lyase